MNDTPKPLGGSPVRKFAPIWEPLGFTQTGGVRRYVVKDQRGDVRIVRFQEIACTGFLVELYQDVQYWLSRYPRSNRGGYKIDARKVAAAIIRECHDKGLYTVTGQEIYSTKTPR